MQDFNDDKDLVKVIKSRKRRSALAKLGIPIPFAVESAVLVAAFLGAISTPTCFALSSVIVSLLNISTKSKEKNRDKNEQLLEDLATDVGSKIGDKNWEIYHLNDIAIIPKNFQVGENLEAINPVPIFKEGKYIIMSGDFSIEILAQYEDEGKSVVKILDREEALAVYDDLDDKTKRKLGKRSKMLSLTMRD